MTPHDKAIEAMQEVLDDFCPPERRLYDAVEAYLTAMRVQGYELVRLDEEGIAHILWNWDNPELEGYGVMPCEQPPMSEYRTAAKAVINYLRGK